VTNETHHQTRAGGSLAARFARGALYLSAANWSAFALSFVLNLAIARVLGPDAFGPYALAYGLNEALAIVGAFSTHLALVQTREESRTLYDTATALSAALGLCAMLASLGLAGYALRSHSAEVAWFIVTLGLVRILNLLIVVPFAKLERSFHFGAQAVVGLVANNVPNLCALGMAYAGLGAWSLVLRDLLLALLSLLLVVTFSGYRPRPRIERGAARHLIAVAQPFFAVNAFDLLLERVDRVALAAAFPARVVGLYHQARTIATAGMLAARPVFQLSFNLYSRVQDDRVRLARAHQIVNYWVARGGIALATVWLISPDEATRLLLGESWSAASAVLRPLAIYSALLPIAMSANQLLMARGAGRLAVRVRIAQAVVYLPGVVAASVLGSVSGVVAAASASTIAGIALADHYNRMALETRLLAALAAPAVACAATWAGFALLAHHAIIPAIPWPCRPLLPPFVFALLLLLVERRALIDQIAFLLSSMVTRRAD